MKIMGSTVQFGSTYAVFYYSNGLFTPILAIFYLPVTLLVGPALLSADVNALGDPQFMAAMDAAMTNKLVIVSQLALSVLALGATVLELVWFRHVFGVGLARTGIRVFAGAAVAILVGGFVVAPILGVWRAVAGRHRPVPIGRRWTMAWPQHVAARVQANQDMDECFT